MNKKTMNFFRISASIAVTACVLVFLFLSIFMTHQTERTVREISDTYMSEMSRQIRQKFEAIIGLRLQQVEGIITRTEPGSVMYGTEMLLELQTSAEIRNFSYLGLYSADGEIEKIYGEDMEIVDQEAAIDLYNKAGDLICQGSPQTKTSVEDLMAGRALTTQLDEEVVFDQLARSSAAVWSLLLAGGYLKVEERIFDRDRNRFLYRLMLTNLEVQMMFEDMIRGWFSQEDVPYNAFLRDLLAGDVDYMNVYMNEVARLTFSNFDTGNRPSGKANPERFYHGFVLGLIVELAGKYRISSNRESGFGRYDIMIEPLENEDPAFVLEFKVKNPEREAALEDTLAQALAQIEKKNYDAELEARGIARERIRHYGFVFEGKRVLIGGA